MKRTLGIILSIIFTVAFFGTIIYYVGLKVFLLGIAFSAIIIGAIFLCTWLITSND